MKISPKFGSKYGGTVIELRGNGFGSKMNTVVKIGENNCDIRTINASLITCVTAQTDVSTARVLIRFV